MTMPNEHPVRTTVAQAKATPIPEERLSSLLMDHGTMTVRYFAPQKRDKQVPHDQDEVYVVISGYGRFIVETHSEPFGPNDVLFVPAHCEHRFEDFSDDFATWVVFYEPNGGEKPTIGTN